MTLARKKYRERRQGSYRPRVGVVGIRLNDDPASLLTDPVVPGRIFNRRTITFIAAYVLLVVIANAILGDLT